MYKTQLEVREWLELPHKTRVKLASDFNLTRGGNSEVVDHVVVSDGYTYQDLSKLSLDMIKLRLDIQNQDNDFYKYFNLLIESYEETTKNKNGDTGRHEENRQEQKSNEVCEGEVLPSIETKPKKRRGRPSTLHGSVDGN